MLLPYVEDRVKEMLPSIFEGIIVEGSSFRTAVNILLRNMNASLIMLFLGITVVVPLLVLFVNGFMAGLILRLAVEESIPAKTTILGVIFHGMPELLAIFVSAAFGLRIGFALFSAKDRMKEVKTSVTQAAQVFLRFILPLLVLSAFIEAYVSSSFVL